MKPQTGAKLALALGLLIALTANLAYAVPKGAVVIGLGLVAPLVLPVVLVLRTTFTASEWYVVALRELATAAVAGPAVAVSFLHTYELILAAGEPWILAVLAPLSSDGLAGLATLALHRMRAGAKPKPASKPKANPERAQQTTDPTPVPVPAAPAPSAPAQSSGDDDLRALAKRLLADGRATHGRANFGRGRLVSAMRAEGHQVSSDWCRQVISEVDADSPIKLVEATG